MGKVLISMGKCSGMTTIEEVMRETCSDAGEMSLFVKCECGSYKYRTNASLLC